MYKTTSRQNTASEAIYLNFDWKWVSNQSYISKLHFLYAVPLFKVECWGVKAKNISHISSFAFEKTPIGTLINNPFYSRVLLKKVIPTQLQDLLCRYRCHLVFLLGLSPPIFCLNPFAAKVEIWWSFRGFWFWVSLTWCSSNSCHEQH